MVATPAKMTPDVGRLERGRWVESALGNLIRARREELGLTQDDLAARIGTSGAYLSQIETGIKRWPRKYVPALARELGIAEYVMAKAAGVKESAVRAPVRSRKRQLDPVDVPAAGFDERGRPYFTLGQIVDAAVRHMSAAERQRFMDALVASLPVGWEMAEYVEGAPDEDWWEDRRDVGLKIGVIPGTPSTAEPHGDL